MTFFLLSTENDFLSLLARIWIEIHFPLETLIVSFSYVIIPFVSRYIFAKCSREQECVIRK